MLWRGRAQASGGADAGSFAGLNRTMICDKPSMHLSATGARFSQVRPGCMFHVFSFPNQRLLTMTEFDDELRAVNQDIDHIVEQKPHIKTLLDAFGPLILEKTRLLLEMGDSKRTIAVDEVRYLGGIPLIQQGNLFFPDDPWREMALAVSGAIQAGFPKLVGDMARLTEQITSGRVDAYDYFRAPEAPDEKMIKDWAEHIPMASDALVLFLTIMSGIILTKRAREVAETIAPLSWNKGYCPVCGSFPMLAVTKKNWQNWLQCSQCSHEWQFPRLKCPYCEHENPKETNYFFIESEKDDKAYTCDECKKYLITINRPAELRKVDHSITAIGLTHLDLLLQHKGYAPMAICVWNTWNT